MKKIIITMSILSSILLADLSKIINIPTHSKILSLTFRYIDIEGNMQTQKLKSDIMLTSDGIVLSQSKREHFLAKIDTKDISRINSFVIEYKDKSNHTFFKPIYYNLALLSRDKPLFLLQKDSIIYEDMQNDKESMPLIFDVQSPNIIDGFTLKNANYPSYEKKDIPSMKKNKVIDFKKYNLNYIKDAMHPVSIDGVNVSKKEKHFCTIPIRDNISYILDKKSLFVIFKDFELTSGMFIKNNKITITFEQENRFKPCVLNNVNKDIIKMSTFYESKNNGEAWFNVEFSSNIKSASIVYPKEKSDIMSYNEELKDIVIYKIEY